MSFSLSSLLNPTPPANSGEAQDDSGANPAEQPSPVQPRDVIANSPHVRSPEEIHASLPKYTPPQRNRPPSSGSSVAGGPAVTLVPTFTSSSGNHDQTPVADRRGSIVADGTFELPQPTVDARKSSSATLEQYRIGSHSPEHRRTSASTSNVMLPPLTEPSIAPSTKQEQEHIVTASAQNDVSQINTKLSSSSLVVDTKIPTIKSPIEIKQETAPSPRGLSPLDNRQASDMDNQTSKSIASLKQEFASRTQSPLRESSTVTAELTSGSVPTRKKAPPKARKGMATNTKKRAAPKKRKADTKSTTKSKGATAASPTPSDAHSQEMQSDDESDVDSNEDVEGSGDVYCVCRKPDNGTFMIGCDGNCDDWFHGKCVGIEERDKDLIHQYICPNCAKSGVGQTSWKRMCRRPGCRKPARVGKTAIKTGVTSKYCSDECGVLFFKQMAAGARGQDSRKRRRISVDQVQSEGEARGGVLSIGEARAILDQSNSAEEFRELGNGVLSPPATPAANQDPVEAMTDMEKTAMANILSQKDEARARHQILKDRLKLVGLAKTEAGRAAAEQNLKAKDYCGYDSRIGWSEKEFAEWRSSSQGQKAFELDTLDPSKIGDAARADGAEPMSPASEEGEVCARKKCARHLDWSKLAVDEVRFEMTDNSDRMRNLEQEEGELKERVAVRAKTRAYGQEEGSVEVHGWRDAEPVTEKIDAMEVDPVT